MGVWEITIEPRKRRDGNDDIVKEMEVTTGVPVMARCNWFPGVIDHGMFDTVITRQPGRPCVSFEVWRVCRTTEEGGRQIRHRESDSFVVPEKAGNAAGGKETTHGSAE